MVASASPSFPALGYGPLGPRLRRNGFATEFKSGPICGASGFPLLATGRSGHGSANTIADTDRIATPLRSLLGNRGAGETVPRR